MLASFGTTPACSRRSCCSHSRSSAFSSASNTSSRAIHWRAAHGIGIGIGCLTRCRSAPSATTDIRHEGYNPTQPISKPR